MTQVNYIKHLREVEGANISEIQRRVGCSWPTAKKYADSEIDLQERNHRTRKKTVMADFEEIVKDILFEAQRMPRKQRPTANVIYKELLALGYKGSDRTVRKYVKEIKERMQLEQQEQYIRLEHFPGEAQVDFGSFQGIDGLSEKKYYELIMSFPHSNAQLCKVVPSENCVCFLTGLQEFFFLIGGVPNNIRFDNLSAAVIKMISGSEPSLTDMFKTFQWHYRFKAEFCNRGKGNEKGHVETKVGYVRRNYFSPLPIIKDLKELNNKLQESMLEDWERIHYEKGVLISELWKEDAAHLLTLPTHPLEIVRVHTRTINKYGEIKIDDQFYRIPKGYPKQKVLVKEYYDRLEVLNISGEELLHTCPRVYLQEASDIDWVTELEIFTRRPRAAERAVYLRALPESIKKYILSAEKMPERGRRIAAVVKALRVYSLDAVIAATKKALELNHTDMSSLQLFAGIEENKKLPILTPLDEPWTPEEVSQWQPDLTIYNVLGGECNN